MNNHVRLFVASLAVIMMFLPWELQAQPAPANAQAADNTSLRPLEQSDLVMKGADGNPIVANKDGSGLDGVKLSQHDFLITSPSMAVAPDGSIHVAFRETHASTFANSIYYRSSADGGKTWTESKNLSEDMPNIDVGRCQVLVDARNRVYVVWCAAIKDGWTISPDSTGQKINLWFRAMDKGKWSKIKPIGETCDPTTQNDAVFTYFAGVDAAGSPQVMWSVLPDKWHPEVLDLPSRRHSNGIGQGLVFQSTLDGATASAPREVFLAPVTLVDKDQGLLCDALDTLTGYFDSAGAAHFFASANKPKDAFTPRGHHELIENGKPGPALDLPPLSFHYGKDIPTLLVDARGKRHVVALFLAGEHPNIRDYLIGSDDEPTVIRAAAGAKGRIEGFQACQGPGGRMVVIMQMNDTGENDTGDNFVSISTGDGKWSIPVNVTNNAGRKTYVSKETSAQSQLSLQTNCLPGPAAVAFDRDGHLLLLMIKKEFKILNSTAFGVNIAGGGGHTAPTLRFLKF